MTAVLCGKFGNKRRAPQRLKAGTGRSRSDTVKQCVGKYGFPVGPDIDIMDIDIPGNPGLVGSIDSVVNPPDAARLPIYCQSGTTDIWSPAITCAHPETPRGPYNGDNSVQKSTIGRSRLGREKISCPPDRS